MVVEVWFNLRLLIFISFNIHICFTGHYHLILSLSLGAWQMQLIHIECSSLLEQYLSSFMLLIKNPLESNTLSRAWAFLK